MKLPNPDIVRHDNLSCLLYKSDVIFNIKQMTQLLQCISTPNMNIIYTLYILYFAVSTFKCTILHPYKKK